MHDVVAEVAGVVFGGHAAGRVGLQVQGVLQRRIDRFLVLLGRDVALVVHQLQHDVPLLFRFLLVRFDGRVVGIRILGDGCDGRGLHHVQLVGRGSEVALGSGLHTIQAVAAELRDVEIALQDLGFGVFLLQLHRDQHFTHFAGDGVFGRMVLGDRVVVLGSLHDQGVFDILLCQRRTALLVTAFDVGLDERTEHALHIHASVFEESLVLTGHDGLLHDFGDFLQRHDFAVLIPEFRDLRLAVGGVHGGFLRKAGHIEINAFHRKRWNDGFDHAIGAEHGGKEENTRHNTAAHA